MMADLSKHSDSVKPEATKSVPEAKFPLAHEHKWDWGPSIVSAHYICTLCGEIKPASSEVTG